VRKALNLLRQLYPHADIKTVKAFDYRDGEKVSLRMIVKDDRFVAWVENGQADITNVPELLGRK
jgi:hypothetical protein